MAEVEILDDPLIENGIRADSQPIEQAEAFKILMDARDWTAAGLAEERHIRDSTVSQALALLALPGEVRAKVAAGELKPATAYELSQLEHPAERVAMAKKVVAEKLTRDQAAMAVREKTGRGDFPGKVRAEIRLDDGRKVTLSGLPDERPETILAALRQATKQVQGHLREASRSEEEAA